ncbi:TetR/AcrR family transcriptional regulator [Agromyces seonyuensis]|uniref:TetR/AcrR family transcriptional regulator n=1 Tax=Agromyces seonyuensis TaxID=2662446 RepID=UPI0030149B32
MDDAPTPRTGSRADRTAQTRERIVRAAAETFIAQGYRATSLRDIAAAADLSHPGLLKHFRTKDELLMAVVDVFEDRNEAALALEVEQAEGGALLFEVLAERNDRTPGYLPLFAALAGEASNPSHPAHAHMRERYRRIVSFAADGLAEAVDHDLVSADRDPVGEAVRLSAAWDGLQVLSQYLPDRISIPSALAARQDDLALPVGWIPLEDPEPRAAASAMPGVEPLVPAEAGVAAGYRTGRERRARILADASALFAQEGYGDTSLRDLAERVGVSKSALLHHFPTKEALLGEVLLERDRRVDAMITNPVTGRAVDDLRALPAGAAHSSEHEPGLVELYAVLSCEAVPSEHTAHDYFVRRFGTALASFTALFRAAQADGDLPSHRDPESEAIWLVALWDGLQYQWLYDHDGVDIGAHLAAHLADVLPER